MGQAHIEKTFSETYAGSARALPSNFRLVSGITILGRRGRAFSPGPGGRD
jgi:hypothetical protein